MGGLKLFAEWMIERFWGAFDIPYLPSRVSDLPRPLLLHVSDTPSQIYPFVRRLIRKLEPDYFVHTGDIADELKLEESRSHLGEYRHKVIKFVQAVEALQVGEIYYVMGNHDDSATLETAARRSLIVYDACLCEMGGARVYLTHDCVPGEGLRPGGEKHRPGGEGLRAGGEPPDLILFGHAPETASELPYFNGLFSIHIISLATREVVRLPYPAGTDNARKLLPPKIGL
jgi:predicted phosphodiesterase